MSSSQHPFVSNVTSNKALRELVAEAKAEVMEEIEDARDDVRDDVRDDGEEEDAVEATSVSLGKDSFLPLGANWLGEPQIPMPRVRLSSCWPDPGSRTCRT